MSMSRYLCQLCWNVVHYGEKHPCFFYKNDDEVYTVPPPNEPEEVERRHEEAQETQFGNWNETDLNICAAAQTDHDGECELGNSSVIVNYERISLVPASRRKRKHYSKDASFTGTKSNRDSEFGSNTAIGRDGPEDAEKRSKVQRKRKRASAEVAQRVDSSIIGEASCSSELSFATHGGAENVAGPSGIRTQSLGSENERAFVCDVCGRHFTGIVRLNNHRRMQVCQKRFACPMCSNAFFQKSVLENHIRTHTGEKPLECDICGERFARKSTLDVHLRMHTGEKPYKCEFCGKEFAHRGNLDVHRRTHTGEKPYKCDWCGEDFSDPSNYSKHLKKCPANNDVNAQLNR